MQQRYVLQIVASMQQQFTLTGMVETDTGSAEANWLVCLVYI